MSALQKHERLIIPARKEGSHVKARPCLGDHEEQLAKVREMSFSRYEQAYRKLAKV